MTTLVTTASGLDAGRPVRRTHPFAHYLLRSLGIMLREWSFLAFVVAMPTTMYLFFSAMYGGYATDGGVSVAAVMMVTMATYGGLGAAMSAGNQIQNERSTGWFRQLMITGLTPAQFVAAKVLVAVGVVIPAIGIVFVAGALRGVRLDAAAWLGSFALLLMTLLPMILLGLTLGLWLKPAAASAATTLVMLALSMLGGLWIPLEMMPEPMQAFGQALPSYWAARIGTWPITGGAFPWQGVAVIATWALVLVGLGALGYRRAVRTSKR